MLTSGTHKRSAEPSSPQKHSRPVAVSAIRDVAVEYSVRGKTTYINLRLKDKDHRPLVAGFYTAAMLQGGFWPSGMHGVGAPSKYSQSNVTPEDRKAYMTAYTVCPDDPETGEGNAELAELLNTAMKFAKKAETAQEREAREVAALDALFCLQQGFESAKFKVGEQLQPFVSLSERMVAAVCSTLMSTRSDPTNPLKKAIEALDLAVRQSLEAKLLALPQSEFQTAERLVQEELAARISSTMIEAPVHPVVPLSMAGKIARENATSQLVQAAFTSHKWSPRPIFHTVQFQATKVVRAVEPAPGLPVPSWPKDDLCKLWPNPDTGKYYVPGNPVMHQLNLSGGGGDPWLPLTRPEERHVYSGRMVSNVFTASIYTAASTKALIAFFLSGVRIMSAVDTGFGMGAVDPGESEEDFVPAALLAKCKRLRAVCEAEDEHAAAPTAITDAELLLADGPIGPPSPPR
jgi:hypothetical protein